MADLKRAASRVGDGVAAAVVVAPAVEEEVVRARVAPPND
jgi:hypothetical protein